MAKKQAKGNIYQRVYDVGRYKGNLRVLEKELLKRSEEFKGEFRKANKRDRKQMMGYLLVILEPRRMVGYFFSS